MKKLLMIFLLLITANCWAATPSRTQQLAEAIARAEGYYIKGSIPNRCNNAGDLKAVRGWRYPGQVGVCKGGHVRFKTTAAGWTALNHQLDKIVEGKSRHYSVNMTLNQVARRYAGNYRRWARNVARSLKTSPDAYLWEVLDVAPKLEEL